MESNNVNNNSKINNLKCEKHFQKYIFDEDFLDEKDKALSPMVLSDEIPGETIKSKEGEKENETNIIFNGEKYVKYGSNIVYIDSKIDDNDEELTTVMNEQVNMIIIDQVCKKYSSRKKIKKKI